MLYGLKRLVDLQYGRLNARFHPLIDRVNMGVFEQEQRPLRARDLCLALELPVLPKHVEGTRAKLKRLVSLGFLDETEPGLFTQPRPQARTAPADQRP